MPEHVTITDPHLHEPKGVLTAVAKAVYRATGTGTGAWELLDEATDVVLIEDISDFPAPVLDVITMPDKTVYLIRGVVDMGTTRLQVVTNGTVLLLGYSLLQDVLSYTGTDPFLTASSATIGARHVGFNTPNANLLDFTNVAPNVAFATFLNVNILECKKIGTISDGNVVIFQNMIITSVTESPSIAFSGANDVFQMSDTIITSYVGTFFDLGTATFDLFRMEGSRTTHPTPNVALSGLADSGNINVGGSGRFFGNDSFGAVPVISGISPKDGRWKFTANNNIPDSDTRGMLYFSANTDATVISIADTYTEVDNGTAPPTFILDSTSERVSQPVNNSLKIDDETPHNTRVQANVSVRTVTGGGNKVVDIAVFESTDDGATFTQVSTISSQSDVGVTGGVIVVSAPITTELDARYQLRIKNITDTTNLVVDSVQFYLG